MLTPVKEMKEQCRKLATIIIHTSTCMSDSQTRNSQLEKCWTFKPQDNFTLVDKSLSV